MSGIIVSAEIGADNLVVPFYQSMRTVFQAIKAFEKDKSLETVSVPHLRKSCTFLRSNIARNAVEVQVRFYRHLVEKGYTIVSVLRALDAFCKLKLDDDDTLVTVLLMLIFPLGTGLDSYLPVSSLSERDKALASMFDNAMLTARDTLFAPYDIDLPWPLVTVDERDPVLVKRRSTIDIMSSVFLFYLFYRYRWPKKSLLHHFVLKTLLMQRSGDSVVSLGFNELMAGLAIPLKTDSPSLNAVRDRLCQEDIFGHIVVANYIRDHMLSNSASEFKGVLDIYQDAQIASLLVDNGVFHVYFQQCLMEPRPGKWSDQVLQFGVLAKRIAKLQSSLPKDLVNQITRLLNVFLINSYARFYRKRLDGQLTESNHAEMQYLCIGIIRALIRHQLILPELVIELKHYAIITNHGPLFCELIAPASGRYGFQGSDYHGSIPVLRMVLAKAEDNMVYFSEVMPALLTLYFKEDSLFSVHLGAVISQDIACFQLIRKYRRETHKQALIERVTPDNDKRARLHHWLNKLLISALLVAPGLNAALSILTESSLGEDEVLVLMTSCPFFVSVLSMSISNAGANAIGAKYVLRADTKTALNGLFRKLTKNPSILVDAHKKFCINLENNESAEGESDRTYSARCGTYVALLLYGLILGHPSKLPKLVKKNIKALQQSLQLLIQEWAQSAQRTLLGEHFEAWLSRSDCLSVHLKENQKAHKWLKEQLSSYRRYQKRIELPETIEQLEAMIQAHSERTGKQKPTEQKTVQKKVSSSGHAQKRKNKSLKKPQPVPKPVPKSKPKSDPKPNPSPKSKPKPDPNPNPSPNPNPGPAPLTKVTLNEHDMLAVAQPIAEIDEGFEGSSNASLRSLSPTEALEQPGQKVLSQLINIMTRLREHLIAWDRFSGELPCQFVAIIYDFGMWFCEIEAVLPLGDVRTSDPIVYPDNFRDALLQWHRALSKTAVEVHQDFSIIDPDVQTDTLSNALSVIQSGMLLGAYYRPFDEIVPEQTRRDQLFALAEPFRDLGLHLSLKGSRCILPQDPEAEGAADADIDAICHPDPDFTGCSFDACRQALLAGGHFAMKHKVFEIRQPGTGALISYQATFEHVEDKWLLDMTIYANPLTPERKRSVLLSAIVTSASAIYDIRCARLSLLPYGAIAMMRDKRVFGLVIALRSELSAFEVLDLGYILKQFAKFRQALGKERYALKPEMFALEAWCVGVASDQKMIEQALFAAAHGALKYLLDHFNERPNVMRQVLMQFHLIEVALHDFRYEGEKVKTLSSSVMNAKIDKCFTLLSDETWDGQTFLSMYLMVWREMLCQEVSWFHHAQAITLSASNHLFEAIYGSRGVCVASGMLRAFGSIAEAVNFKAGHVFISGALPIQTPYLGKCLNQMMVALNPGCMSTVRVDQATPQASTDAAAFYAHYRKTAHQSVNLSREMSPR